MSLDTIETNVLATPMHPVLGVAPLLPTQPTVSPPAILLPPPIAPPIFPPGMPATDPTARKWLLTDDQVQHLTDAAGKLIPSLQKWWPVITSVMIGIGTLGTILGRVTAPAAPQLDTSPPVVATKVAPPLKAPDVLAPYGPPKTLTLHATDAKLGTPLASDPTLKALLAGQSIALTVDPKTYAAGSTYQFRGNAIPLPCAALLAANGTVIDVGSYQNAQDLSSFVSKHLPVK